MRELTKWLQSNQIVVLIMFTVSLASGVVGLALGWKQFYQDYLSNMIEVPIWLAILALLLLPSPQIAYRSFAGSSPTMELLKVKGKKFGVQQIVLDGTLFERCEFHGTELVFEGSNVFSLVQCTFHSPRFSFSKYAATTLAALTKLYTDGAFRPLIEQTIQNIRTDAHPQAVSPSATE